LEWKEQVVESILKPFKSRQMRRLGMAVAITGAAAAVAASVVLAERPESDRVLPPSASAEPFSGSGAIRSEIRAQSRSPKDAGRLIPGPWVKPPRFDTLADKVDAGSAMATDLSLPDTAGALKDAAAEAAEASPTF
jgi:hypothetical protein